ncbi:MAG: HIT domain-containing protein [Anaerolineales bacterium]|nr:HIT domain-containing protein [Anaerolineales bacterium]
MNHLWSPWRMTYIQDQNKEEGCVFCKALETIDGSQNLVVFRGQWNFVILNRFPYTSGHLMVVPKQHTAYLPVLDVPTMAELMELASQSITVLSKLYHPQGYNLGMNLGEVAGAGIAEHIHLHIVPRWGGDTNFMSTTAATRVLPEALEDTYCRIKEAWL